MTHTQRVKAMMAGQPVDRPPYIAWGPHLNLEDRNIHDFTQAVIAYEEQFDFDILKVMQNGLYMTEDWGQLIDPPVDSDDAGFKKTRQGAFTTLDDWRNAEKKDVHQGAYAREIESIRIICEHFGADLPVLPTVFGPGRLLWQLCDWPQETGMMGHDYMSFVRAHEKEYFHVMDVLTEQVIDLMNAYLDVGAAGFFYCPHGNYKAGESDEDFEKYIRPYDVRVLEAVKDRAWFTMLHVCGDEVQHMDRMVELPAAAVNWEDQGPLNPSLAEVRAMTDKVLMGGIDRHHDFAGPDRAVIKSRLQRRIRNAMKEAGDKLVIAVGCESSREITHRFGVWREVMEEMAAESSMG